MFQLATTTTGAFDEFDEALKLDPGELRTAIDAHHKIRDQLAAEGLCASAILQGSLARKTMLAPLRDIDMIGFLNPAHRHLQDDPDGPVKSTRLIIAALRRLYPDSHFSWSTHAVKVENPDWDFTFDVVPAFDREGSDLIDIANTEGGVWEESNTRALIAAVQQRNQHTEGNLVHQVRMGKHWGRNDVPELPGLDIESAFFRAITSKQPHSKAVAAGLHHLAEALEAGTLYDPTGTENLLDRLEPDIVQDAAKHARWAADRADEALGYEKGGDQQAAIGVWHQVFGEPFPTATEQTVESAFQASLVGGVTSSGRATSSRAAHTPSPPVRSWRRR